ncbi:MAG: hypothetical protein PHC51_01750 [bacterium]|nr:hypothetical protein [bacterium]
MAGEAENGPWSGRLVIMLFGAAVAAIGFEPLDRRFGGAGKYVRYRTVAHAGDRSEGPLFKNSSSVGVSTPEVRVLAMPSGLKAARSVPGTVGRPISDHLNQDDRTELNNLLKSR